MHRLAIPATALFMGLALGACSSGSDSVEYVAVKMDGNSMWSVIKAADGTVVLRDEFKNAPFSFSGSTFIVENSDGEYDVYDINNVKAPLNKESFVDINGYNNGAYAMAVLKNSPITIINRDGEEVATLPKNIKYAYLFGDGLAPVETTDGKCGYVDTKGEVVIPTKYDGATIFNDGVAMVALKDGDKEDAKMKVNVIDKSGEVLYSFSQDKYDRFSMFSHGYFVVRIDDDAVVLDRKGEKVCKLGKWTSHYAEGTWTDGKLFLYYDGDNYGIKNAEGETVVRAKYDNLGFVRGVIEAEKDDKYGTLTPEGEEQLAFDFSALWPLGGDRFLAKDGNSSTLIGIDGKEISKDSFDDINLREHNGERVRSQYFDADGFAAAITDHLSATSAYGISKGATLNNFRSDVPSTAGWDQGHKSSLNTERDDVDLTVIFEKNLARDEGPYYAYDWQYNWNAPVAVITWKAFLTEYGTGAEEAFSKAFDQKIGAMGFERVGNSPLYKNASKGTAIAYGYEDGQIFIAYFFNTQYVSSELNDTFKRVDRKGNSVDLDSLPDEEVVVEEVVADDTCVVDTCVEVAVAAE